MLFKTFSFRPKIQISFLLFFSIRTSAIVVQRLLLPTKAITMQMYQK